MRHKAAAAAVGSISPCNCHFALLLFLFSYHLQLSVMAEVDDLLYQAVLALEQDCWVFSDWNNPNSEGVPLFHPPLLKKKKKSPRKVKRRMMLLNLLNHLLLQIILMIMPMSSTC